jgi:transposase
MAFLGLVPGEDSTGEKHRRGRITRMGNALVRRLLVETAWHYQHRPGIGVALTRRRKGQPGRVIAIADKAQQRLCRRFRRVLLPRARYHVYYVPRGGVVLVLAVWHAKRGSGPPLRLL